MLDAGAPPHGPAGQRPGGRSDARFGARALLAGLAIALVAVPFSLLLLLVRNRWPPLLEVDEGARDALHEVAVDHGAFVAAMEALSTIGSMPVYFGLFTLVAVWLTARRLPRLALFVVVAMLGSWLLNSLVKIAVDRARPVLPDPVAHAGGMSFPSGHAQSATVATAALLLVFLPLLRGRPAGHRIAVGVGAAMVLAIGFSRVALGVHYVSDVLAGYVLGAAWVAATTAAFSAWRREHGRPPVEPARGLEPEQAGRLGVGRRPNAPASSGPPASERLVHPATPARRGAPGGAASCGAVRRATMRRVSRRDLAHVLTALWDRSSGRAGTAVAVTAVDEAIGRHRGDMRTPLNLESLRADGLVVPAGDDAWALTPEGVAWLRRDRELSGG